MGILIWVQPDSIFLILSIFSVHLEIVYLAETENFLLKV